MTTAIWDNTSNAEYTIGEPIWNPRAYRCHVALIHEKDGAFPAIVLNLPGAGSCGDSEEEAIANAREAVAGVIESYLSENAEIPWIDQTQYTVPSGAKQKWILVNV